MYPTDIFMLPNIYMCNPTYIPYICWGSYIYVGHMYLITCHICWVQSYICWVTWHVTQQIYPTDIFYTQQIYPTDICDTQQIYPTDICDTQQISMSPNIYDVWRLGGPTVGRGCNSPRHQHSWVIRPTALNQSTGPASNCSPALNSRRQLS